MTTYREERIRRLAYELWEREGRPQGRDAEHWRMATEAYESALAGTRFDDAGQPIEVEHQVSQERAMDSATAASKARRGRKPQVGTALPAEITPAAKRKRRTKAEMAAAAAGVAGAAAAVVATVVVTKRRRGAKAETANEAAPAPAANAALRQPRRTRAGATLPEAEPTSDALASDVAIEAAPDPSADGPTDVATGLLPDPGAEPPSDAELESFPESGPGADPSGERVAD
jgi:hypothetical protein